MLGGELHGIENAQNFVKVAACAHRIAQLEFNLFVWADYEHSAHRGVVRGRASLGSVPALGWQHAIELGDFKLRIADHRIVNLGALSLLDIRGPLAVTADWINAEADNFCISFGKFGL